MKTKNEALQDLDKAVNELEKTVDAFIQAKPSKDLDFGDYCTIEQHRYGCDNEHYIHKVIGRLRSNAWVDVPVMHNAIERFTTTWRMLLLVYAAVSVNEKY